MTDHALEHSSCVLENNNSILLFFLPSLHNVNVINAKRGCLRHTVVFQICCKYSAFLAAESAKSTTDILIF